MTARAISRVMGLPRRTHPPAGRSEPLVVECVRLSEVVKILEEECTSPTLEITKGLQALERFRGTLAFWTGGYPVTIKLPDAPAIHADTVEEALGIVANLGREGAAR